MSDNRSIAVFDSGLGGLTVLGAIRRILPQESTIYLGDTARVPYGMKSPATVVRYALNNARTLLSLRQVKLLVIACGTATSHALSTLENTLDIKVLGTILPSVQASLKGRSICVLATLGTVNSGAYEKKLKELGFSGDLQQKSCPLFAPLVEEGMIHGTVASLVADQYLQDLRKDIDTIILGCTHYPMLAPMLKAKMPGHVKWVDSSEETAKSVETYLRESGMLSDGSGPAQHEYYVTDCSERFEELSEMFLGEKIPKNQVRVIDV